MKATTSAILFFLACGASAAWLQESSRPLRAAASDSRSDAVNDAVRAEMQKRRIPGLSLAIIQDGKIVKAKGYGVTEKGGDSPVTTSTLFQAGSISKPVAALGALRLVEQGKLALDEDVNARLVTWKVPENEFTKEKKVTLRGLLSHTAGPDGPRLPRLCRGWAGPDPRAGPGRCEAREHGRHPGRYPPRQPWRYSGGGYTVMQQMVIDVTGRPFPRFMQEAVLGPLGMEESTFEQPLPAEKAKLTATGTSPGSEPREGEMAHLPGDGGGRPVDDALRPGALRHRRAGGRWRAGPTRPCPRRWRGRCSRRRRITTAWASFLEGSGSTLRFGHGGRDEGFDARLTAYAETGQGAAIMINANDNSRMVSRILEAIAREYHWPEYPSLHSLEASDRRGRRGQARRLHGALRVREQPDADLRGGARSSGDPGGWFPRRGVPAGHR